MKSSILILDSLFERPLQLQISSNSSNVMPCMRVSYKLIVAIILALYMFESSLAVESSNKESIAHAYANWLSLSNDEVQWLSKTNTVKQSLLLRMNPDQAIVLATKQVADLYKKSLYSIECQVVFFRGKMSGNDVELYQVKVFFYLTDGGTGAALCESVLIRSDMKVMIQRR